MKAISISDVKTLLGSGSNDLGTLCRHPNINKWSRHKPVCWEEPFPNPAFETHWEGKDHMIYGMYVDVRYDNESVAGLDAASLYESDIANNYTYVPPTGVNGDTSYPYRLIDFSDYSPNARPFLIENISEGDEEYLYPDSTVREFTRSYIVRDSGVSGSITIADIERVLNKRSEGSLQLVASIYYNDRDYGLTLLTEYCNNGIELYEDMSSVELDGSYTGSDFRKVTIPFKRDVLWGATNRISYIYVYLSLRNVKKKRNLSNGQYYIGAESEISIPYDSGHYYKKVIKFYTSVRRVQSVAYHKGATSDNRKDWVGMNEPYDLSTGTPDVHIEVSRIPNSVFTIKDGTIYSRYKRSDGKDVWTGSTLTTEQPGVAPSQVVVPEYVSGQDNTDISVYLHFGDRGRAANVFQEANYVKGRRYTASLYVVQNRDTNTALEITGAYISFVQK